MYVSLISVRGCTVVVCWHPFSCFVVAVVVAVIILLLLFLLLLYQVGVAPLKCCDLQYSFVTTAAAETIMSEYHLEEKNVIDGSEFTSTVGVLMLNCLNMDNIKTVTAEESLEKLLT